MLWLVIVHHARWSMMYGQLPTFSQTLHPPPQDFHDNFEKVTPRSATDIPEPHSAPPLMIQEYFVRFLPLAETTAATTTDVILRELSTWVSILSDRSID
jgi:hypothetical protein